MKDKQLETASFFGRIATFLLVAFIAERLASVYFGEVWGAALTVALMLTILAGLVLWTRWKRR